MTERVLSVWPGLRPAAVAAGISDVAVRSAGRPTLEEATYHDAADLRLLRTGIELRHDRASGTWQVTVSPSTFWHRTMGDEPLRWSEPAEGRVPGALRGVLRGAEVTPAVRLRTRRQGWWVEETLPPLPVDEAIGDDAIPPAIVEPDLPADLDADPLGAELALEEVSIFDGRRLMSRSTVLRVIGDGPLVRRLTDALVDAGAERISTRGDGGGPSTLLGGLARRPVVVVDDLPGDPTAADAVRQAIARSVARLLANDVPVRLDVHPEGVHQARVATRRLRSDLRTFGELVDEKWADGLREELKWLADALGSVRDADVMGERLRDLVDQLGERDRDIAEFLLDELADQRADALAALATVMDSDRYTHLLDQLVAAAADPQLTPLADEPAAEVFAAHAAKAWKPLSKSARAVPADEVDTVDIDQLHRIRIKAKRFRYAADAAALVDPAAGRHAEEVAELQDELGELHDAAVTEDWLRGHVDGRTPEQAFVLGQLVMAERAEVARRRRTWLEPWAEVRSRRHRRWMA